MPAPVNADLIQGRWFDGQSSRARPVMVGLRATPQGPSLAWDGR